MALQWFKFYGGEYLCDPKIMGLSPAERSCFLTLLCLASVAEIVGEIKYITEEKLMVMAGLDIAKDEWGETLGIFDKLERFNIIKRIDNETISVIHFRKKQDIALTNYERLKKHRDKTKINDNGMITRDNGVKQNDNARIEENRIDNNIYSKFSFNGMPCRRDNFTGKWKALDNGEWLEVDENHIKNIKENK